MNYNFIHIPQVDSTNRYAHQLITSGSAGEGDVITTHNQTSGVGQVDNFWESEPGKNLTMSIIVEPRHLEASNQFVITQQVSLAIWQTIKSYLKGHNVYIKWPNDIYVNSLKLGGVLIQNFILGSSISFSIIGIGININQRDFLSDAPNPVSMAQITNESFDITMVRDSILNRFNDHYNDSLYTHSFIGLKQQYLSKLFRINELTSFEDSQGKFRGKIKDVDEYGRLIIMKETGMVSKYLLKEVKMIL